MNSVQKWNELHKRPKTEIDAPLRHTFDSVSNGALPQLHSSAGFRFETSMRSSHFQHVENN